MQLEEILEILDTHDLILDTHVEMLQQAAPKITTASDKIMVNIRDTHLIWWSNGCPKSRN